MANPSHVWLMRMAYVLRYYAAMVASATILADVSFLCELRLAYIDLVAGGSLVSCLLNYLCVRALGYCYVQRHLIWMTTYNILYNTLVLPTTWSGKAVGEIVMLILLSIFLIWAIIHYLWEIRVGKAQWGC